MNKKDIASFLLYFKLAVFVFILLSPVLNFQNLKFLDNVVVKVIFLAIILGFCFVDFQLALLATIAFLLLLINLNNVALSQPARPHIDRFMDRESVGVPAVDTSPNLACVNTVKSNINQDLFNLYIDDKIKPYEIFIKMMTDAQVIEKAQGVVV